MERGQLIWIMVTGGLLLLGAGTLKAAAAPAPDQIVAQQK